MIFYYNGNDGEYVYFKSDSDEGRQEPQTSSLFRTPTAGSLQSWDRRVRCERTESPTDYGRLIHLGNDLFVFMIPFLFVDQEAP